MDWRSAAQIVALSRLTALRTLSVLAPEYKRGSDRNAEVSGNGNAVLAPLSALQQLTCLPAARALDRVVKADDGGYLRADWGMPAAAKSAGAGLLKPPYTLSTRISAQPLLALTRLQKLHVKIGDDTR